MIDFKEKIAEILADATNLNEKELESYIEMPKDSQNGDYAFPCFRLAKELRKNRAGVHPPPHQRNGSGRRKLFSLTRIGRHRGVVGAGADARHHPPALPHRRLEYLRCASLGR